MSSRADKQTLSPMRGHSSRGSANGIKSATSRKSSAGRKASKSPGSRANSARSKSPKSRMSSATSKESMPGGGKSSSMTSRRVRIKSAELADTGLKAVDMSGQGLTAIGGSLFNRTDVGELDLSSNNLRVIPTDIKKLTTLVHIDLSRNGIRCGHAQDFTGLPRELANMPNLEILIISECNLPFIPPAIWMCRNLKVLDISRNKINMLVPDIGNMEKLQHLNAQQTSIITLPPEIALCQDLEEVLLWGNVIETLPETLREMPNLKVLAVNYRSFSSMVDAYREGLLKKGQIQSEHIPPVLFEIPALDCLDLNETRINLLPDNCVGKLKEFYIAQNFFKELPGMVLRLEYIEILDISDNMIKSIPDGLSQLSHLKLLKMSKNQISLFPASLGKLEKLESLFIDKNQIQSLPDTIGNMISLRTLVVNNNNLRSIPPTIVNLEKLETLDLTANHIKMLPISFHRMKKLKKAHTYHKFHKYGLWLHLNPLTTPPPEIWKTEDTSLIYDYLKRLQIQRTENLQRQKLFFIGESQCGKTSLVRSMTTGKSDLTDGIGDSTAIVEFSAWKTDNGVDFLVHDLGGADVYQTIHPLFLDPKAIYLLVYDHSKYTADNYYQMVGKWLEFLRLHVPNAVVKLIGTQDDLTYLDTSDQIRHIIMEQLEKHQEKNTSNLTNVLVGLDNVKKDSGAKISKSEYDHLMQQIVRTAELKKQPLRIEAEVAVTSSAVGIKGISNLISELESLAVDKTLFPDAQKNITETWFRLRLDLKKEKDHCLTLDFCQEAGKKRAMKKDEVLECLAFLSDCGEILWLKQIPALKNVIFQRPCHLVQILQGIFQHDIDNFLDYDTNRIFACKGQMGVEVFNEAKKQLNTTGMVSRSLLKCMWFYLLLSDDKFEYLLELIPQLDLCYVIPQPEFPNPKHVFTPLMVMPMFNMEDGPTNQERAEVWPYPLPPGQSELSVNTTFPQLLPLGLWEKMSCRIHDHLNMRMDWTNEIFAEMDTGAILLQRQQNTASILIKSRGTDLTNTRTMLDMVIRDFTSILSSYKGLIWRCEFNHEYCLEEDARDYCPQISL